MFAIFAPLAIAAPFITEAIPNGWFPTTTLVYCAIYAMFGVGLNIVVGYAGLLDLGYVAFFLFGAYGAAWFMSTFFFQVNENGTPPGFHLWGSRAIHDASRGSTSRSGSSSGSARSWR